MMAQTLIYDKSWGVFNSALNMHTHTVLGWDDPTQNSTISGLQRDTVHFSRPKPTVVVSNASPFLLPPAPVLPGPLDEGPVDGDGLAEHLGAVQVVLGRQCLLVRLELDEGVAFEEPSAAIQVQVQVLDLTELGELSNQFQ